MVGAAAADDDEQDEQSHCMSKAPSPWLPPDGPKRQKTWSNHDDEEEK